MGSSSPGPDGLRVKSPSGAVTRKHLWLGAAGAGDAKTGSHGAPAPLPHPGSCRWLGASRLVLQGDAQGPGATAVAYAIDF